MMAVVRRMLLALGVLAAVVVGVVVASQSTTDPRTPLVQAIGAVPAEEGTISVTGWAQVRDELDLDPAEAGEPSGLRRLSDAGFGTDLTAGSLLVGSVQPMQREYGWSVVGADWEAYAQSRTGAVGVVALGGIDAETVLDGLRTVGYREPAEDADSGAVWAGGPDLVAGTDPALTPQLGYLAVLADEGLVVLSDAERYASRTVAAIRGDEPALADDPAVTAVALRLGEPPVAVAHTGDRGCTVTSLADASRTDQRVADQLAADAGGLVGYDALGLGLAVHASSSSLDVVMRFDGLAPATDQLAVRTALSRGDAPAQGGTWEERFAVKSAAAEDGSVVLRLLAPERDAPLLSDLGTGGPLFASC